MSHGTTKPFVTVVIPSHGGADRIVETLDSLAHQTMDPSEFEVVVVLNGVLDDTPDRIQQVRRQYPRLRLRTVQLRESGAGRARNAGIAAAAGQHLTFVDDDDAVSPGFLESLAAATEDGVIPLGMVADVLTDTAEGLVEFDNYLNRRISMHAGQTVTGEALSTALGFVAAKLVPTALARTVAFDPSLRSGEDVVYWFDLFNRAPFLFRVVDADSDAAYHRSIRAGSLSRQIASYDFSVSQRLEVVERLASREVRHPEAAMVRGYMIAAQINFLNGYLREALDEHRRAVEEIRERGLEPVMRYDVLNAGIARDLAVCYAFPPWADTSGSVAARRIRRRGVVVDVVSQSLRSRSKRDLTGWLIAQEFIGEHAELAGKAGTFNWRPIERFVTAGIEQIADWEATKGRYRSVYSRTMWAPSNVLAGLYKLRHPETTWIAEFSDPQQWDSRGHRRSTLARPGLLRDELVAGLAAAGVELGEEVNVAELVELLAYALADEIVFTNENQREVMLGYLGRPELEARVRSISKVCEHPTLEPTFYHLETVDYPLDPGFLNLAYFGNFYATRGLTEVVTAIRGLTPEQRARVRLHVFTAKPDELEADTVEAGLDGVIIANPYVSYLGALNLATRMDVLLVNDARTEGLHARNPYLPSKWSDYAGSDTDVWAITEVGSVLSTKKARYQSPLGDAEAARAELATMLEDHL
jgi:glycosyltransferase involved in cell wall biosynthesis